MFCFFEGYSAKSYSNLYIDNMATKKSLSLLLSLLMVFTLISLFPTITGKEGECQPQGKCEGQTPVWTCKTKCIHLGYELGEEFA
ncbi:unnamed protein product [Brassica oleracea]|uniref:(rape) hypothetical protein n=1 Tax=Brassica napus TaxID=3708 RepID=A0A816L1P5_BRANA|nr:unnamed protein product [Brassica napus]